MGAENQLDCIPNKRNWGYSVLIIIWKGTCLYLNWNLILLCCLCYLRQSEFNFTHSRDFPQLIGSYSFQLMNLFFSNQ